jgi:hypothetical protein
MTWCKSNRLTRCTFSPKGQTCFAFTTCRPSPKPASSSNSNPVQSDNSTVVTDSGDNSTTAIDDLTNETESNLLDEGSVSPISTPADIGLIGNEVDNSTNSITTNVTDDDTAEIVNTNSSMHIADNETDTENENSSISTPPAISTPANDTDVGVETFVNTTMPTQGSFTTEQTVSPIIVLETASPVPAPFMDQLLKMTEPPSANITIPLVWADSNTNSPSTWIETETRSPSPPPSIAEIAQETISPTPAPSGSEEMTYGIPPPSPQLVSKIGSILKASTRGITNDVLLYMDALSGVTTPTTMYQYEGFLYALSIYSKSLMGSSYFYFGDETDDSINYGLVNVALFLANAAIETVRFDICDDISWEKDGKLFVNGCFFCYSYKPNRCFVFVNTYCYFSVWPLSY